MIMKREYVRPELYCEKFVASEYVAACITGLIQCAIPGNSKEGLDDGTKGRFGDDGLEHGLCGNNAEISFDSITVEGYEVLNGRKQLNRHIYDINGYKLEKGTYTVTWKSDDGANNTGTYSHHGRLIINNIDDTHPNHS